MKWILSVLFFTILTTPVFGQEFNAGFVQGLWYGDKEVLAEKTIRVYVAIRNNTGADLTGTVEFFDNDTRIERNNVSALDGRIIESWADWTPSYGEHTLTATLSRTELHTVGTSTEAVEVVSTSAADIVFADLDTDNDGIGNNNDTDDDGDGVSDAQEKQDGTDPLVSDESDEDTAESTDTDDEESGSTSDNTEPETTQSSDPEGLEQFTNEGRTDSTLSSVTDVVNNSKKKIDSYRAKRNVKTPDAIVNETIDKAPIISQIKIPDEETDQSTTTAAEIFKQGFGTVTREQTEKKQDEGFFATVLSLATTLISSIYTFALYLVSLYLGHPIVVQLTLLFLILYLLYKVAKRLGQRDNS